MEDTFLSVCVLSVLVMEQNLITYQASPLLLARQGASLVNTFILYHVALSHPSTENNYWNIFQSINEYRKTLFSNPLQSGRTCLLFKPFNQWRYLYEFVNSHQEYALEGNLLFIPSNLTLFHPAQIRDYTELEDALYTLCRASPVPQLFLDFQFTGANWSKFKAHSLLSTHSHAVWTSGSWHQRQTGSHCTAPLANVDMDNISSRWWAGWSQILHGRMYFLFASQLSS